MTPIPLRQHRLRRAHLRLLVRAVEAAQEALHDTDVLAAAGEFFGQHVDSERTLQRLLADHDAEVQFLPWLLWDAAGPSGPLGARLLGQTKGTTDRQLLRALLATPPALWRVRKVEGATATLQRLGDGTLAQVYEPLLEQGPPSGELLVARVVELGDLHLLDAVHMAMPAACAARLVRSAVAAAALPRERQLRALLRAATRVATANQRPAPRILRHDGLKATLVFGHHGEQACSLALQQAVQAGELECLGPRRYALTAASGGPPGAVLRMNRERLHASTIRPERLDDLRQFVVRTVPAAVWTMTVHRDLARLFDPAQRLPSERHGSNGAELRALASDWLSESLASLADTPLDQLGGATLRQAAKTRRGRPQVKAWLQAVADVAAWAEPRYQSQLQALTSELNAG